MLLHWLNASLEVSRESSSSMNINPYAESFQQRFNSNPLDPVSDAHCIFNNMYLPSTSKRQSSRVAIAYNVLGLFCIPPLVKFSSLILAFLYKQQVWGRTLSAKKGNFHFKIYLCICTYYRYVYTYIYIFYIIYKCIIQGICACLCIHTSMHVVYINMHLYVSQQLMKISPKYGCLHGRC